jgi:RimJ/RimL family protein N-acetyltransferase
LNNRGRINVSRYWEGKLVRLRPVEPGDAPHHHDFNEEADSDLIDVRYPPGSLGRVEAWAERQSQESFDGQAFSFQVVDKGSGELVGGIATHHCDQRTGVLSYGLHVLPGHRGKGYAKEAICLILRYYFQELRYQKANVAVYDLNQMSKALHLRLGFAEEGRQRRTVFTRGEWWDLVWFGMTVEEFRELHPDYWLAPA